MGLDGEGRSRWWWKPIGERPQFALTSSQGPGNFSLPRLAPVSLRTEGCRGRGVSLGLEEADSELRIEKTAHTHERRDTGATVGMRPAGPAGGGSQGPRIFGPRPRLQTATL